MKLHMWVHAELCACTQIHVPMATCYNVEVLLVCQLFVGQYAVHACTCMYTYIRACVHYTVA